MKKHMHSIELYNSMPIYSRSISLVKLLNGPVYK